MAGGGPVAARPRLGRVAAARRGAVSGCATRMMGLHGVMQVMAACGPWHGGRSVASSTAARVQRWILPAVVILLADACLRAHAPACTFSIAIFPSDWTSLVLTIIIITLRWVLGIGRSTRHIPCCVLGFFRAAVLFMLTILMAWSLLVSWLPPVLFHRGQPGLELVTSLVGRTAAVPAGHGVRPVWLTAGAASADCTAPSASWSFTDITAVPRRVGARRLGPVSMCGGASLALGTSPPEARAVDWRLAAPVFNGNHHRLTAPAWAPLPSGGGGGGGGRGRKREEIQAAERTTRLMREAGTEESDQEAPPGEAARAERSLRSAAASTDSLSVSLLPSRLVEKEAVPRTIGAVSMAEGRSMRTRSRRVGAAGVASLLESLVPSRLGKGEAALELLEQIGPSKDDARGVASLKDASGAGGEGAGLRICSEVLASLSELVLPSRSKERESRICGTTAVETSLSLGLLPAMLTRERGASPTTSSKGMPPRVFPSA